MAILVKLPATLSIDETIVIDEPVATVAELMAELQRRYPALGEVFEDSVFNVAVNDEILLHRARERSLEDGDTVELIPAISGG